MIPPTNPKTKKALVFTSDTSAKHFFDKGNINMTKKCCANCLIFTYHDYNFPDQIKTASEKYKNKILTMLCNTCHNYRNWTPLTQNLDECFLKSLELRLKFVKCDHLNNQGRCKNVDFHLDSRCLYETDRHCALKSMEAKKI